MCLEGHQSNATRRGFARWPCVPAALVAACAILAALGAPASGSTVSYDLSVEFSGAAPPEGSAPWLKATFDDGGSPGSVSLTLTATNLTGDEFVGSWMFNLDPTLQPTDLQFSAPVKTGTFSDPPIGLSSNGFTADGDGDYDIEFDFVEGGGANDRFGVGEAAEYTITGIAGLTADSFDFLSFPHGGQGPFHTAAHVQGIGEDSGWVTTVPGPASLSLLAVGAIALARRRRR